MAPEKKILKPNFFILSMSFCCHSKKDWQRPYNVLFSWNILSYSFYLGRIFINIVLSRSACINILTQLSCSISKSNLIVTTSKRCKKVIAKIVALVGRL